MRARAAANRRLSTAVDIRLAVLLGAAIWLYMLAAAFLWDFATSSAVFATAHDTAASGWRELLAGLLTAAAAACAWRGRRRLLFACAPAAAAAVIWLLIHQPAYDSSTLSVTTLTAGAAGSLLLCLAALMLLARQTERPPRSWLWLIGLIVATQTQLAYASYLTPLVARAEAIWPLYAILLAVGGLALWRLRGPRAVH